ncbi:hypothetical protein P4689_12080 [Priestia megaterium]|uniref:hypothetical protein n=1 Tax=Priestia megaterium TaxID=1404 RepID=UPI002E2409B8|nr:hypothetical protein [Priestia megaterium]
MENFKQFYKEKLLKLKQAKTVKNTEIFIGKCKTVNKNLRNLLIIAALWVFAYDFILVHIPAWRPIWATIGLLARNVSFAFITGFIFFFVNTHLSSHKTKVKTYQYTANKITALNALSSSLMKSINKKLGLPPEEDPETEEEFKKLCKKINAPTPVKYMVMADSLTFQNWYVLFNFLDMETSKIVKDLLLIRDSLDSETLRLVTSIENKVNMFINMGKGNPIGPDDSLEFFAEYIFKYRGMCKELTAHLNTEYKPYADEYHHLENKKTRERREQKAQQQSQQQEIQS